MIAGVAYSSFAFRPLWHPPLVRNASFAIQNTIPMESMNTLKFVCFVRKATHHGNITTTNSWESLAIGRNPLLMSQLSQQIPYYRKKPPAIL